MKKEPTAFLVREKGFDLKTLFIPVQGFNGQFEIGHQIDWMSKPPFPSGDHRDRTIALFGKPNLRNADFEKRFTNRLISYTGVVPTAADINMARTIDLQRLLGSVAGAQWRVLKTQNNQELITNDMGYRTLRLRP